ncbi:cytochrome P450 [Aurantimicrobium sp. MWH-Uga1]|uniref:cytochrome P450 n=1 Tax=Aurantimicrobium sp. MWH-Uga1 TaxID=2079575 RepID=UPI000DED567D|nr:cytochrome P450 [Aurantimicrobium sp. MWH-Uga1]AXE55087.1 Putative cytochrome P450 124 [Aurantimicrobium sp. MWH-Uga1]
MATRSLADLDVFDNGAPWDLFAELRANDPVNWSDETDGGSGFWSVMRYHDIVKVLRDPETFTSSHFTNLEELEPDQEEARRSLLDSDGTRHRALRRLLQNDFTPNNVAKYETFLRGLTATTLDNAFAKGEFDFLHDVAADYPIRVLARLLEIPDTDIENIIRWGNAMIGSSDPSLTDLLPTDPESEKYRLVPFRSPAALEVFAYGDELKRQRVGRNGTDIISTMINSVPMDGKPLTDQEYHTNFLLLIVAGHETTRQTIAHTMNNLMNNPEVISYLQENPQDIPWAVEEFLRYASPIYHFRRTATKDVEFGGKEIKAGQKVVTWFASGNRDPEVFADPEKMVPTRMPNEHMTFGRGGPHMCLGNALARIELIIMFEDVIRRIDKMERTGPMDFVHSNFIHGIKSMPVKVTLR